MMRLVSGLITIIVLFLILCSNTFGIERFPPPDFESGHQLPTTTTPQARQNIYEILDVAVLSAALALSAYLILKKRNRQLIFLMMVFSLVYFGFFRKGCICPIGGIGNVALSAFDGNYAIPLIALGFFSFR